VGGGLNFPRALWAEKQTVEREKLIIEFYQVKIIEFSGPEKAF
jgi:hypothetical protein